MSHLKSVAAQVCLFFTALFTFKLKWMVLVVIGLVFTVSNLVGFLRCRMGSSMAGAANQYVQVRSEERRQRLNLIQLTSFFQHQLKNNIFNMFKSNKPPPPQS